MLKPGGIAVKETANLMRLYTPATATPPIPDDLTIMKILNHLVFTAALAVSIAPAPAQQPAIHLVPTPKEIKVTEGRLELKPGAQIAVSAKELMPLATVLSGELLKVAGLKLPAAEGPGRPGDIVLKIDKTLPTGEARHWPHTVTVAERIEVTGLDYNAVAMGTSTLLQLIEVAASGASMPRLALSDYSVAEYPGLMLDVARQNNTLQDVRDCIDMCRLYKVRYFQLHLNDMESFMFPSKVFPKLGKSNGSAHGGPKCELWNRDELLATIQYADQRGVTLLPELETVFHTGSMMRDMPEEFGGPGVLNMGSEKLYQSLDPLIEEMCDVFKSSPFFQIGCDEASIGGVLTQPGTKEYMQKHQLNTADDLYRFHINRLDKVIAGKGKRTIVWQDCPLPLDNKNIICMVWHMDFNHGETANIIKKGNPTIQVTWTPSCGSPVTDLFGWRPFDEQIRPGKLGMGSQLVLWEQNGSVAIPFLRQKMPARQQFTHSPDATLTYQEFAANLAHTDSLLDPLTTGMIATESGLKQSVGQWLLAGGRGNMPDYTFVKNVQVTLKSNLPGAKIHYTLAQLPTFNAMRLYGKEVTADAPLANGPIAILPPEGEAVCVQARAFDAAGKPLGGTWSRTYRWQPFSVAIQGTVADGDNRFGKAVTIAVTDTVAGGTIRYAVGQALAATSPVLDKPVTMDKSGGISLGFFDPQGKPRGLVWQQGFRKVDFDATNITYKKPVILWGSSSKQSAGIAVDGVVDHDQYLDMQPAPQEFAIDLEAARKLNKVVLYTYWDGGRIYQYKIDVSTDRKQWTTVADASKNSEKATEQGYAHTFPTAAARYIRVTMLHNSSNPGLHIVELRAYEAK